MSPVQSQLKFEDSLIYQITQLNLQIIAYLANFKNTGVTMLGERSEF